MIRNLIIVLIIVGPGLAFDFFGKPTEMGLAIVAGAIAAAFINIDKIQKFKGAGFEAEMRKAVDEAYATLEQVHEVACTTAEVTLSHLMESNFVGNISFDEKLNMHDKMIDKLKRIGASDEQIKNANNIWNKGIIIIYHRGISNKIQKDFEPSSDIMEVFKKMTNFKLFKTENADAHREFLFEKDLINEEINLLLEDFKYFEETGQINRREEFVKL